jgi:hypothetical protein
MKNKLRYGALALGLVAGVALMTSPAAARSFHEDSDFGGTWSRIGPSDQYTTRHDYYRYRAPDYHAYYGPPAYYEPYDYYDPGYYGPRGGVSFGIGID